MRLQERELCAKACDQLEQAFVERSRGDDNPGFVAELQCMGFAVSLAARRIRKLSTGTAEPTREDCD